MKVSAINSVSSFNYSYSNKIKKQPAQQNVSTDSISFKHNSVFEKTLKACSENRYTSAADVRDAFESLFNIVKNDSKIIKQQTFYTIQQLYEKNGFQGLLYELWKAQPSPIVKRLINASKGKPLTLAQTDGNPVFMLENHGPCTFIDTMKENYDAKRLMHLTFNSSKNLNTKAKFLFDTSGQLTFWNHDRAIRYHISTGTPKTETIMNDGRREIIHYNKDGTKNFWKNLLFGGVEGPEDFVV